MGFSALCFFLFSDADADDAPDAADAADAATLGAAGCAQAAVLSHARPAQPWLGQVHQLGQWNPARPMAMPVAMPTRFVKAVVKPVARPLRWVFAAPMQRNQGCSTNQVVLPCQELLSTKVMAPEQKELPKELPKGLPKEAG